MRLGLTHMAKIPLDPRDHLPQLGWRNLRFNRDRRPDERLPADKLGPYRGPKLLGTEKRMPKLINQLMVRHVAPERFLAIRFPAQDQPVGHLHVLPRYHV